MASYEKLKSYQNTKIIYDFTVEFCQRYIRPGSRTRDQMEQAARSGKQNIAEGSQASWISQEKEYYLIGVARHSLEELLRDYEDFLRQRKMKQWEKELPAAKAVRALAYRTDKSYRTYGIYMANPEQAANAMICLINQTNLLLDRQLERLKKDLMRNYAISPAKRYRLYRTDRTYRTDQAADRWLMESIWQAGNVRLKSGKIIEKNSKEAKVGSWDVEFEKFVRELGQM